MEKKVPRAAKGGGFGEEKKEDRLPSKHKGKEKLKKRDGQG